MTEPQILNVGTVKLSEQHNTSPKMHLAHVLFLAC